MMANYVSLLCRHVIPHHRWGLQDKQVSRETLSLKREPLQWKKKRKWLYEINSCGAFSWHVFQLVSEGRERLYEHVQSVIRAQLLNKTGIGDVSGRRERRIASWTGPASDNTHLFLTTPKSHSRNRCLNQAIIWPFPSLLIKCAGFTGPQPAGTAPGAAGSGSDRCGSISLGFLRVLSVRLGRRLLQVPFQSWIKQKERSSLSLVSVINVRLFFFLIFCSC